MINWTNIAIYGGMAIFSIIIWYFIVFYVLDWLGL